jgi:hypothetical protein
MWAVIGLARVVELPKAESLKAELDKVIVTERSGDKEEVAHKKKTRSGD